MNQSGTFRSLMTALALLSVWAVSCAVSICRAQDWGGDPVEDLRQALLLENVANPDDLVIKFRIQNLNKRIAALKTIGDLRRALALDEWRESLTIIRNETLRQIDQDKRREVGLRLTAAIEDVVKTGDADARLAVATMISEMGTSVRALDLKDRGGYARSLAPQVMKLAVNSDVGVRQQALRALGNINPEPGDAVKVFNFILDKDRFPENRLLAAQGLGQMMRVILQLRENGKAQKTGSRIDATQAEVMLTASHVVPAARRGLKDAQWQVRAACLETIDQAVTGLLNMIPQPFDRKDAAPEGRLLNGQEIQEALNTYELVRKEMAEIKPYVKLFEDSMPALLPALSDSEASVRLAAITTLESVTHARLMMKQRLKSVPLPANAVGKVQAIQLDDPLASLLPRGLGPIEKLVCDDDVRIRRLAAGALENMDTDAIPAIPTLAAALRDPDRFMRWAVTRTLGKLPVKDIQPALPNLEKLLEDEDGTVRKAAAETLQNMGKLARPAMPALASAIITGDSDSRQAAMRVIVVCPPEDAKIAVPNLIKLLSHEDANIRKYAAETLGRIGPLAHDAVPALRRLLGDYDPDVRRAASDAILSIVVAPAK